MDFEKIALAGFLFLGIPRDKYCFNFFQKTFVRVKYSSCFLRHATFTVKEVLSTFFEFPIIHSAYPPKFA